MDVTTEATCRSVVKMERSAEKYYTLSNSSLAPTVPASIYIAAKCQHQWGVEVGVGWGGMMVRLGILKWGGVEILK